MIDQRGVIPLSILILLAIIIGGGVYFAVTQGPVAPNSVTSFKECAAAGYPIMESYPRQCAVPNGQSFVEVIEETIIPANDRCAIIRCKDGYYCDSATGKCVQGRAKTSE
jgi:hypothetical protein